MLPFPVKRDSWTPVRPQLMMIVSRMAKNHDGDLSDGEEAPNRSLFHQAGGDETSQERPSREEEDSLDDHSFLFVEGEERREHQKRMESNSRDDISRVSHGHRP